MKTDKETSLAGELGDHCEKLEARIKELEAENLRLRNVLAYEAVVVRAHYEGYKSPPKSRVLFMTAQAKRMEQEALTPGGGYYDSDIRDELDILRRHNRVDHPVPRK